MKAFLWNEIEKVSSNYHSGGSVLVVAESLERAREIALIPCHVYNTQLKKYEDASSVPMEGIEEEPDAIFEAPGQEEKVWVFQDAGCC